MCGKYHKVPPPIKSPYGSGLRRIFSAALPIRSYDYVISQLLLDGAKDLTNELNSNIAQYDQVLSL